MSQEIREQHKTGIGGSGAAACFGVKAFVSPHDLYASCLGIDREKKQTWAMDIGNTLEPKIRAWYEAQRGNIGTPVFRRHQKHDWMLGNLDWIQKDETHFAEFKFCGMYMKSEWGNPAYSQVPLNYFLQGQHYSNLTGIKTWDIVVSICGDEPVIYPCESDPDIAKTLFERERHFWENHVLKKVPPPPDGSESCRLLMNTIYKQKRDEIPWIDPDKESDSLRTINQLFVTNRNAKAENDNLDELKNKARSIIGERLGVKTDLGVVTWKARADGVRVLRIIGNDEDEE